MMIHQLPASSTIADGDMIPFDTGTANKYITAGNLFKQSGVQSLSTSQDITTSVAALTVGRAYFFRINSYNAQSACGVPANENYDGIAYCATSNNKIIEITGVSSGLKWLKRWNGTVWSDWKPITGQVNYTPTSASFMSSGGFAYRKGGMMTWEYAPRVTATTTVVSTDYFARIEGLKVPGTIHFLVAIGTGNEIRAFRIINNNNGIEIRNNNTTVTVTENQYIIGSVTFPVEEV